MSDKSACNYCGHGPADDEYVADMIARLRLALEKIAQGDDEPVSQAIAQFALSASNEGEA